MRGDSIPRPNGQPDEDEMQIKTYTRRVMVPAIVVDQDGQEIYKIISTAWGWLVLSGFAVLLMMCLILSYLVLKNSKTIDKIEREVKNESNTRDR